MKPRVDISPFKTLRILYQRFCNGRLNFPLPLAGHSSSPSGCFSTATRSSKSSAGTVRRGIPGSPEMPPCVGSILVMVAQRKRNGPTMSSSPYVLTLHDGETDREGETGDDVVYHVATR